MSAAQLVCVLQDVVQLLLEQGADYDLHDCLGNTAMYEACKAKHDDIVELLLQYSARCDAPVQRQV